MNTINLDKMKYSQGPQDLQRKCKPSLLETLSDSKQSSLSVKYSDKAGI